MKIQHLILSTHTFLHQISHSIFLHLLCIRVQRFCLSSAEYFIACRIYKNLWRGNKLPCHRHVSLSKLLMVIMNVTCILCIYMRNTTHITLHIAPTHGSTLTGALNQVIVAHAGCFLEPRFESLCVLIISSHWFGEHLCVVKWTICLGKAFYIHYTINKILNVHRTIWLAVVLKLVIQLGKTNTLQNH